MKNNKLRHRILSRPAHHRRMLMRNLTSSLLKSRSIVTTEAKGKELRKHIEPLITSAKGELTLAKRRQLLKHLLHKEDLPALLEVAKANATRPGGYLRLTKLPITRTDAAKEVRVDILGK